jgi:hypothetical protein
VNIEVKDSNAFETGSHWRYEITPRIGGGCHVHMEFDRRPKNFKGRLLSGVMSIFGKQIFQRSLADTLSRLESRPSSAGAPPMS